MIVIFKRNFKIIILLIILTFVISTASFIHFLYSGSVIYAAFGDSLAQGYPYNIQNKKLGYTDLIYNEINSSGITKNRVAYKNYAKTGITSSDLYDLLSEKNIFEEISKADIITINIGGNDLIQTINWHGINNYEYIYGTINNYMDNLNKIFSELRTKNRYAGIYFSSLYNPITPNYKDINYKEADHMIKYVNGLIEKTAVPYNVKVVDITSLFNGHEYDTGSSWFYDMLHPNQKGYSQMSKPFINTITNDFSTKSYMKIKIKKLFNI